MSGFIADENFPHPSFRFLTQNDIDVIHVGLESPSIDDREVLRLAIESRRVLLTLDSDHGELIYRDRVATPAGYNSFSLASIQARPTRPRTASNDRFELQF